MKINKIVASLFAAGVMTSPLAHATNGMNLEGYGPVAAAMGGASMAYDNGTAAVMNNPATLGLMSGGSRLDVALGVLAPSVTSNMTGMPSAESTAKAFYMPAVGYANKSGQMTYGVGLFSQGGMGTEYEGTTFMSAGSGKKSRSEVGVGRLIAPLSYQVDDKVTVGGSVDFVWAQMDLKMALSGGQFLGMMPGSSQTYGAAGGSMITGFGNMMAAGMLQAPSATTTPVNWGYFDFSDSGNFTGQAKGSGLAAKVGFVYKMNPDLTIGGVYHSRTRLTDLKTTGASLTMNANVDNNVLNGTFGTAGPAGAYTAVSIPVTGSISVKNFQWPETYGLGMAYQVNQKLMVVADYKRIGWRSVMKNFNMTFTADTTQTGLAQGFSGTALDATLFQNWVDQNVFEVGGAYKTSDEFTVRAGLNLANNPIPDKYMNPLFPAIARNHVTLGVGYAFSKESSVDFDYVYVPKMSATNGQGVTVDFGGYSSQLMYSFRF
ncbi:MAG: outer membrane protein transport protein [Nitrosomonadales bacterium]|nr:outer membrane protein transport protein [Nitrosomonadales bacterium]